MADGESTGSAGRQEAVEKKRGGYQGTHDPGQPNGLMQQQISPVSQTAPPAAAPAAGEEPASGSGSDE